MADDTRILALVEEALASDLTPEEVCVQNPELLADVRACLDECRDVDSMIDRLFPTPGSSRVRSPRMAEGAPLPKIPGYDVLGILGRGGIGVIYRARHLKLNRIVALKMLLSGEFASPTELARFRREAEAIAALHHCNIVQIYDVGDVDGRPYFTMEFVDGGTLAHDLSGIPQPAQYSAKITETLARAVYAAHLAGIVHRDLKPDNILLTQDGTPKITDFGLARHFEQPANVTLGPAKVGTPSYMAPEQVIGEPDNVGPAADIYALGATLYELLTGRPPFRGETAIETEQQLVNEEPASPSKLNANVPRDLETICLKCLQKEPASRYATALDLADDLKRFSEGRPILARPVGWAGRSWRWARRNPTAAALLLSILALVALASGGGTWRLQQRSRHNAELANEVGTAITEAVSLREGFHFNEARALLEQARQRLGTGAPEDLRRRVEQAQRDLRLVERLDDARSRGESLADGKFDPSKAEPFYVSAFTDAGLNPEGRDSKLVAASVRGSTLRTELIAALDDWASLTPDHRRRDVLLDVARQSDPNPARNPFRKPELWDDGNRLTQLAHEPLPAELSAQLATALSRVASVRNADAIPLLTAAHARFPQDLWLNFELAAELNVAHRPEESLGYARAALALRPKSSVAHFSVGASLQEMGRLDEAMDQYRQALDLEPNFAEAHHNLGDALRAKSRLDEAADYFRQAIAVDPQFVPAYIDLAVVLQDKNQFDEAADVLKDAIRLDPRNAKAHNNLAAVLRLQHRVDEAIPQLREAVAIDPTYAVGQMNLGEALWVDGRVDEAIEHIQLAARLDPPDVDAQAFLCDHLYSGACNAVRETLGRQAGKAPLDEMARANLRLRALDWLRASLNLVMGLVDSGRGQATSLMTWENEPDLASVREPRELAKLPRTEREHWQRFWAVVAAEIVTDPVTQARERAAHGDWAAAASLYARTLARGPNDDGHFRFECAAVFLLSGNRQGYANACAELIERCGKPGGPRAYHVARAGTLSADAAPDSSVLSQLARDELEKNATQFWSLTEQGALAYRAGRFEESASLFERSLQVDAKPGRAVINWLWLAMADQKLGKTDEACRWLDKAETWLDEYRDGIPAGAEQQLGLHLHNWLEANVLRREAEALVQHTRDPRSGEQDLQRSAPER